LRQLSNKIAQSCGARKIAPRAFVVFSADAQAANIFTAALSALRFSLFGWSPPNHSLLRHYLKIDAAA
jgi:hypothetical protein